MSSTLKLYKGPEEKIRDRVVEDGAVYFATDTKKIYLDCDFTDSLGTTLKDRLAFGGSSGIFYGNKGFDSTAVDFTFYLSDFLLGTTTELPELNDLILDKDGAFYRVIAVGEDDDGNGYCKGQRLTVAGVGGGGSGGPAAGIIDAGRSGSTNRYFSSQAKEMPITYFAVSPEGASAVVSMRLVIDGREIAVIDDVAQGSREEPASFDLAPYASQLGTNRQAKIMISFFDDFGNVSATSYEYRVRVIRLELKPARPTLDIEDKYFDYYCSPVFDESFASSLTLHFELIDSTYNVLKDSGSIYIGDIVSGGQASVGINYFGDGTYTIRTWLTIEISSTQTMQSAILEQDFIFQKDTDAPYISATFPSGTFNQYDTTAVVKYKIGYKDAKIPLRRTVTIVTPKGDVIPREDPIIQEDTKTDITWTLVLDEPGTYTVSLEVLAGNTVAASKVSNPFTVTASALNVPVAATTSLALNLEAKGRINNSVDRDTWYSTAGTTVCEPKHFEHFNWGTNGWQTHDGVTSLHLDNGAKFTVPFSPFADQGAQYNGKTIEFDIKISNIRDRKAHIIQCASISSNGVINTGIIANGEAFCLNSSSKKPIGLLDAGERVTEDLSGLIAYYQENARAHITYVITPQTFSPNENTMPKAMVYTYINGVISGLVDYESQTFQDNAAVAPSSFIFDASQADIDIYNLRVYNVAMSDRAVLQNYLAGLGNIQEATRRWNDNKILNTKNKISLSAVREAGNIPYMVFKGGVPCTKKGKVEKVTSIASLPGDGKATGSTADELKKDYRLMEMYYVEPTGIEGEKSKFDIGSWEDRVKVVAYPQGTSSMGYPVKNLRIKFTDRNYQLTDTVPPVDLFCLKADYMESSSANNTGTGNVLNEMYGSLKTPAQIIDPNHVTAIIGKPIICFFKPLQHGAEDPDDNEDDYEYIGRYNFNLDKSTHEPFGFYQDDENHYGVLLDYGSNEGIWGLTDSDNFAEALKEKSLVSGFYATRDEEYDSDKVYYFEPSKSARVWTPSQAAIDADAADEKSTKCDDELCDQLALGPLYEYYDATKGQGVNAIQCWECLTNTSALTRFQSEWDEEADKVTQVWDEEAQKFKDVYYYNWTEAFESRYPEFAEEQASDKRAFSVLVNWIASTNQSKVLNEPSAEERETNPNGLTPLVPDPSNPNLPRKDDSGNLMGIGQYYYDSKEYRLNKFATEFDTHMRRDFTLFYYILTELLIMMDSRAKNMMLCCFDANCDTGTGHWFPIFYDMDTACGLDNTGKLIYRYDEEDYFAGVFNSSAGYKDQYGRDNDAYGTLWCNIRDCVLGNLNKFREDIQTTYKDLRNGKLTYDNLVRLFNDGQANAWNETYINQDQQYKYIDPKLRGDSRAKLFAAQGTRSEFRAQFLRKRLAYLDSKYNYGANSLSLTDARINKYHSTGNFDFKIWAADSTYIWYSLTNGVTEGPKMIREGDYLEFTRTASAGDSATGITEQEFFLYFINNIKDFGDLSNKYFSTFKADTDSESSKGTTKVNKLIMGRHKDPSYKEHFEGQAKYLTSQDTSWMPLLEEIDFAYIPKLQGISLAQNKYLKRVYAEGTSATTLNLPEGGVLEEIYFPKTLTDLTIKNHPNLTTIVMEDNKWDEAISTFSIQGCPGLKHKIKDIFKALQPQDLIIYLPDLEWDIDITEDQVGLDDSGVITNIPVLDKLLIQAGVGNISPYQKKEDGSFVTDDKGQRILAMGRGYVGGKIHIHNDGLAPIDEVDLFDRYVVYYPNLQITFDTHPNNVLGYTLNAYNSADALISGYPRKIRDNEVNDKFSFASCFETTGAYYLPPATKNPTNKFSYEFRGWNNTGIQIFEEDAKETAVQGGTPEQHITAARNAADQVVKIAYDPIKGEYTGAVNDFNFATTYDKDNKTYNLYPTFVGIINSYTVTFNDGLGNGIDSVFETQSVRFGSDAEKPNYVPSNTRLPYSASDHSLKSQGYIRPFKDYGADDNKLGPITADTTFTCRYYDEEDIRKYASPQSYFKFTTGNAGNIVAQLLSTVNVEALTIPLTNPDGAPITRLEINSSYAPKLKRIFLMEGNSLKEIGNSIRSGSTVFEYFDFANANNLQIIGSSAFAGCANMYCNYLPDSVTSIVSQAFQKCKILNIAKLPSSLETIGQFAFDGCESLGNCDMSQCTELRVISTQVFQNCINFNTPDLSPNLTEIGNGSFKNCKKLSAELSVLKTPYLTKIGDSAFSETALYLHSFPTTLTSIGMTAFSNLSTLSELGQIPASVSYIGMYALLGVKTVSTRPLKIYTNDPSNFHQDALAYVDNLAFSKIQVANTLAQEIAESTNGWGSKLGVELLS